METPPEALQIPPAMSTDRRAGGTRPSDMEEGAAITCLDEDVQEACVTPTQGLDPNCNEITMLDPRYTTGSSTGVIAFYFPGRDDPCDLLCNAGFLGNFFDISACCGRRLQLEVPIAPGAVESFTNAETAFQALKHWNRVGEFADLSAEDAFRKKVALEGQKDSSYAGFGSNWAGMLAVLQEKFKPGTEMADALLNTQDTFLLEHNAVVGRDKVWSNNSDGTGQNWLGMQLMLLRDVLRRDSPSDKQGDTIPWSSFIASCVDPSTGRARRGWPAWQNAVAESTGRLRQRLDLGAQ